METDLLPMSLGDIFDEAFDLYKRNFALFAGIVAVVHVPATLVWDAIYYALGMDRLMQSADGAEADAMYAALGLMAVYLGAMLVYSFLMVVQNGALTVAVSERYLGRPISLGAAYRRTAARLFRLLATWMLVFVLLASALLMAFFFLLMLLGILAAGLGAAANSEMATAVIAVVFLVISVAVTLLLVVGLGVFVTQAVIIEGQGYIQALTRNWQLVGRRFLHIFGACAMLLLITASLLLTLVGSVGFGLESFVYPWLKPPVIVRTAIGEVLTMLVLMFLQPFWMVCLTLFYYDQRVRREGFDLSLLERQVRPATALEARP